MSDVIRLKMTPDQTRRLDIALSEALPKYSRRQIKRIIDLGGCHINQQRVRQCGFRLQAGKHYSIHLYPFDPISVESYAASIKWAGQILFQDPYVTAVNKPGGIAAAATRASVKHHLTAFLQHNQLVPDFAECIHRLDLPTSGIILLGHSPAAISRFSQLFQRKKISKFYLAVVSQRPAQSEWHIEAYLSRQVNQAGKVLLSAKAREGYRYSLTNFRILESTGNRHLLLCQPQSGRLHQLRVHLASIGCPIDGDRLYGSQELSAGAMMLHCCRLAFVHPFSGKNVDLNSGIPARIREFGWSLTSSEIRYPE